MYIKLITKQEKKNEKLVRVNSSCAKVKSNRIFKPTKLLQAREVSIRYGIILIQFYILNSCHEV